MKLRYTHEAAAELERVVAAIEEPAPQGARRMLARVRDAANLSSQHPYMGLPTSLRPMRRIVVTP